MITPLGQLNTTALHVADVYVQIVPPQFLLNGVPSNIGGLVGSACWGPVDEPVIVGSMQQYTAMFGDYKARKYDMGTYAAIAFQQGAHALKCVRVTDGDDAAATVTVQTNCLVINSKYTGSAGNSCAVTIANGSKAGSFMVRVAMPGMIPEVFNNIGGTGVTGVDVWVAIADAINNGIDGYRGPSDMIVATAGVGTTAPTLATLTLSGGVDGAANVTKTELIGADTLPRTGMYALRNQDVSVLALCDMDDSTVVSTLDAFGLVEGIFIGFAGTAGQSISAAKTAKANAGMDTYAVKWLLGDHVYWNDTLNKLPKRLVSPAAFWLGKRISLAPQHSTLNKRVLGVVGTEKSETGLPYTYADLQELAIAGIDVLCNPAPGGTYFAFRNGRNASSNAVIHGENYTTMTNYIAKTLDKGMGIYVGELQSYKPGDETRRRAKVTLDAFLEAMVQQRQIDDFRVVLDVSNNPANRIALGYMQADVQVRYLSVVEFFIINLEGGQSVTISRQGAQQLAA